MRKYVVARFRAAEQKRFRRLLRLAVAGLLLAVALAAPALETNAAAAPDGSSTAGASAVCSRATARAAMAREHLLANPQLGLRAVGQLFCGPFAGPGSRGMAASAAHGVCMPFAGWGAFRYVNGDWELIPGGYHPGILRAGIARSGNDIVEKATIRYPGETVCTASGLKKRVWHWNGSRLVAGPWQQLKPPKTSPPPPRQTDGYFKTPSGNIVCYHSPGPVDRPVPFIGCGIKSGLKPAPPRRPCSEGGYAGDRVIMTATGRVTVPACAGDPGALVGAPTARVLGYGKTWSGDGISCRSTFAGLTCRNRSGHGFFLSRARYRTF